MMREILGALSEVLMFAALLAALFMESVSFSVIVGALYIGHRIDDSVVVIKPSKRSRS